MIIILEYLYYSKCLFIGVYLFSNGVRDFRGTVMFDVINNIRIYKS